MKKSLNGSWRFKETTQTDWLTGTVPGCNYLDLLQLGKIEDPFYGTNETKAYWVAQRDWEYTRHFSLTEKELCSDKIQLNALMLDTICSVYINDALVGKGQNSHVQYSFDVKSVLQEGKNSIRIVFRSPVNYVKEKYAIERCPQNCNGQNGIPHIRKPQSHFGWDWGPVLPPSGISDAIYLEFLEIATITDFCVTQQHKEGQVTLSTKVSVSSFGETELTCHILVTTPNGEAISATGASADIVIESPELWWTYELSGRKVQPLYTVRATLLHGAQELACAEKCIGLRTIELNRDKDQYGSNFQFILNGVPLFIKGTNWIPPDSFPTRVGKDQLRYFMDAMRFSNMNMMRVWGGGYYESDTLYDLCDQYGILMWQDFAFACQAYPFFDAEFLANVKEEVACNVKRLRHHASLAIWSGNNEIESMSLGWISRRNYVEWTEKFFHHILEPEIRKYDEATPYIPGSPCGISHNKGVERDNVGDTHLWAVWHGLQPMTYYRKRLTRFCSEFGFESLPDSKTIQRFAKPSDYSLTSDVFTAHQKCTSGNMKMLYYIAYRFRLPKHFKDFIYLSQVVQQECISDATEHWRRNKGRCNGAMFWQLNDCWPVCSWASIDYYGNYKALQYTARHFNAPLSVSIEDSKKSLTLMAINDFNQTQEISLRYQLFDFAAGVLEEKEYSTSLAPLQNKMMVCLDRNKLHAQYNLKKVGLRAQLLQNGRVASQKTVLFHLEKDLILPKAQLKKEVVVQNNQLEITVSSDAFARLVRVESLTSTLPFSDNYFDLLPGECKTITLPLSPASLQNSGDDITLFCSTDVVPDGSKAKDFIKKAKVFSKPANFVSWLYNRCVPADIEV